MRRSAAPLFLRNRSDQFKHLNNRIIHSLLHAASEVIEAESLSLWPGACETRASVFVDAAPMLSSQLAIVPLPE